MYIRYIILLKYFKQIGFILFLLWTKVLCGIQKLCKTYRKKFLCRYKSLKLKISKIRFGFVFFQKAPIYEDDSSPIIVKKAAIVKQMTILPNIVKYVAPHLICRNREYNLFLRRRAIQMRYVFTASVRAKTMGNAKLLRIIPTVKNIEMSLYG